MRRLLLVCCSILFLCVPSLIRAEDCDAYCQKLKEIDALKGKISELQGQAKTLSQAVSYLTNKKTLTQRQVEATQSEIEALSIEISSLGGKIETTEETLDAHIGALITDVQHSYKQQELDPYRLLLSSQSFADLQTRSRYVLLAQSHHAQVLQKTAAIKDSYDKQKQEKVMAQTKIAALKKKLEQQRKDIEQQEQAKKRLLSETKNSESNYQKLLSQAEAALLAFKSYVASQGGASILTNQTFCSDWGCYYNQRDSQWGPLPMGLSTESVAESGCLISSAAMIATHYGKKMTPSDIAIHSDAFFYGRNNAPLFWNDVNINGIRIVRTSFYNSLENTIDGELSNGRPVIVGLFSSSAPKHFIVLKGKVDGHYIMNDPFMENGHDANFSVKYRLSDIRRVDKVSVN